MSLGSLNAVEYAAFSLFEWPDLLKESFKFVKARSGMCQDELHPFSVLASGCCSGMLGGWDWSSTLGRSDLDIAFCFGVERLLPLPLPLSTCRPTPLGQLWLLKPRTAGCHQVVQAGLTCPRISNTSLINHLKYVRSREKFTRSWIILKDCTVIVAVPKPAPN